MNRSFSLFGGFALVMSLFFSTAVRADDYKSDPVHSFVVFDVHHLNAGFVYGTFVGPTGSISYDANDLSKTTFNLSVDTDTIDTRNENRDKDLKGPDFFDAKQYATLTFKSTSVKKTGDNTMDVTGDLTFRGVTKSITVPMEVTGTGTGMQGETRTGFQTSFTIDRTDYGMVADPEPIVGKTIHIIVAVEAIKQYRAMPFTASQILTGIILPAALLGLVALLVWRPWKRDAVMDLRWIFGPLVAGAFGIAYWTFEPKPAWPPVGNVVYLLFYLALAAGILSLADAILKPPLWLRAGVLLLAWRMAVRLLLASQVPRYITEVSAELWIDFLTLAVLTWWLTFENLAERVTGVTTPLLLAAVASVSAILLLMDLHIQSSGALAGALVGLSITAAVLGFWNSRIAFSRGFAQTVVLILQLTLVHGYFYTNDDWTSARQIRVGLLLATPLLAFIGDLPPLRRLRPSMRLVARAIPVILVLAFVAAGAARDFARADQAAPAM